MDIGGIKLTRILGGIMKYKATAGNIGGNFFDCLISNISNGRREL